MTSCYQGLAAFLKAIGYLIPLMDAEYANYYTREVMLILIREFQSPDEEMKKIVLKVNSYSVYMYTSIRFIRKLSCFSSALFAPVCSNHKLSANVQK